MNRPPDDDVVEAIEITTLCQELGCLPRSGGLFDQDAYHVQIMKYVVTAFKKVQAKTS